MEKRISKPHHRFHKDTDGNAMVFVVLVLFTLVCFLVFTIHVGQRFTNKVEMQNAADAAVISGAIWKARGFNLISILNVTMSECLALIIMFKAFDSTLTLTKIAHKITLTMYTSACSSGYGAAFCGLAEIVGTAYPPLLAAYKVANNVLKRTWKSSKILWKLMKGLKKVSKVVSVVTSTMAYLDASRVAELNGASIIGPAEIGDVSIGLHAVLWPIQFKLPVKDEDKSFQEQLCPHTKKGGDGYDKYLCYDDAFDISVVGVPIDSTIRAAWDALTLIIPPPLVTYEAMKQYHYDELCSTSGSSVDPGNYLPDEDETMQCDICSRERGRSEWTGIRIELSREVCDDQYKKKGTQSTQLGTKKLTDGKMPGTVINKGIDPDPENQDPQFDPEKQPHCKVCSNLEVVEPQDDSGGKTRYYAEIWTLKKCKFELDKDEVEMDSTNHDDDKEPPLVLADDWEDSVKYTSLVFKRENKVDSSHLLGSDGKPILSLKSDMSGEMITYGEGGNSKLGDDDVKLPKRTWAVARAVVYVPEPGQKDLFNQNWHAKLAPVDVKGISSELPGLKISLPEKLKNLMNDAVEEIWTH